MASLLERIVDALQGVGVQPVTPVGTQATAVWRFVGPPSVDEVVQAIRATGAVVTPLNTAVRPVGGIEASDLTIASQTEWGVVTLTKVFDSVRVSVEALRPSGN